MDKLAISQSDLPPYISQTTPTDSKQHDQTITLLTQIVRTPTDWSGLAQTLNRQVKDDTRDPSTSRDVALNLLLQKFVNGVLKLKETQIGHTSRQWDIDSISFRAKDWNYYLGIEVDEPPLPPNIQEILEAPCPFFEGKKVKDTHVLTLIPKGITIEKLQTLTSKAKEGHRTKFRADEVVWEDYKNVSVPETRWILATTNVIPGSQGKSWEEQEEMAKPYKDQGYEIASVVDLLMSIVLPYVKTGTRAYADDEETPGPSAQCADVRYCNWSGKDTHLIIGSFTFKGLSLVDNHWNAKYDDMGVSLTRRLF